MPPLLPVHRCPPLLSVHDPHWHSWSWQVGVPALSPLLVWIAHRVSWLGCRDEQRGRRLRPSRFCSIERLERACEAVLAIGRRWSWRIQFRQQLLQGWSEACRSAEDLRVEDLRVEDLPVQALPVKELPVEALPVEVLLVKVLSVEVLLVEVLTVEVLSVEVLSARVFPIEAC